MDLQTIRRKTAYSDNNVAKLKADREQLNRDIKLHIKTNPKFTPSAEAVAKIKAFIK
jgi:hypothetical protein